MLGLAEIFQLQSRLRGKGNGAVEKVGPRLILKLGEEVIPNGGRKEAQRVQDYAILQHYHLAPFAGENCLGHEVFEDQEDLHQKVQQIELGWEVVDVNFVMMLRHLPGRLTGKSKHYFHFNQLTEISPTSRRPNYPPKGFLCPWK